MSRLAFELFLACTNPAGLRDTPVRSVGLRQDAARSDVGERVQGELSASEGKSFLTRRLDSLVLVATRRVLNY